MGNDAAKPIPNDIKVAWTKDQSNCPFQSREGFTSAVVGHKVYLFGGVTSQMVESDALYIYDVDSSKWTCQERPSSNGAGDVLWPSPRSNAAMTSSGEKLYLFGGLSQEQGWLDDFYTYDTNNKVWSVVPSAGEQPSARDKAEMCAGSDGRVYLFGGFSPDMNDTSASSDVVTDDGDEDFEDLDVIQDVAAQQNAMTFKWSNELFCYHSDSGWKLMKNNSESAPSPRAAHAMTSFGNDCIYVLGGRDSEDRQKDLWKYDVTKESWEIVYCNGAHPIQASYRDMVAVGNNRLVTYGGRGVDNQHSDRLDVLDVASSNWLQPEVTSKAPPGMGTHRMCVCDDTLLIFGGTTGFQASLGACEVFYNSVWKVPVSMLTKGGVVKQETEEASAQQSDAVSTSS